MDDQLIDKLTAEAENDGIAQLVVGAVVTDGQGRVLLLKRPADDFMGGLWELPSGKVDPGERLDAALAREVKEETGLDIARFTAYLSHFDYTSGSGKPSRQFNFAIEVSATEPVVLTEHDDFQWREITDKLPVSESVKQTLATLA
ncbi:NUDIX hydrolase [Glycomyces sp. NPDC048151]|uniref:NUDIX hydrolase n=1 Tax=Glycomyces sp. NPDC048151 TaxID=3364002 RepID=UPI003714D8E3